RPTMEEPTTGVAPARERGKAPAEGGRGGDPGGGAEAARPRQPELSDPAGLPGARRAALPPFVEPSLAQLADRPPKGKDWIHEIKFDGYRTQARIDGRSIKLLTRKGLDWTERFEPIAETLKTLRLASALIDGAIHARTDSGVRT